MRWWTVLVALFVTSAVTAPGTARAEGARKGSKVVVDAVRVEGALEEGIAKSRFEKRLAKISRCARPAKGAAPPDLAALLTLRVLVDEAGRVVGATVERASGSNQDLDKCVRLQAMDVRYPRRKGGGYATVRYDLRFGDAPRAYGILGALRSAPTGGPFGSAGVGSGSGGLGLKGTGRGGGGSGHGTIGLGKLGTIGHGRGASAPTVRTGTAVVTGSLSREIIRRYIRRHINQVRYCYERELTRHPALSGRVVVEFIIGPTGAVTSASVGSTTLGNTDAEQCVARAVQRIAFPQPEGGGVVSVRYPFEFSFAPAP